MGIIYDMYQKWKEKREKLMADREDIDDSTTTDKYLRSLRRQRRMQLEEFEKAKLLKGIRQHEVDRANKHLWGIKHKGIKNKRQILTSKYNFLSARKKQKGLYRI